MSKVDGLFKVTFVRYSTTSRIETLTEVRNNCPIYDPGSGWELIKVVFETHEERVKRIRTRNIE